MANKYMVRCSTSLIIRKMQIKPQDIISHLLGWLLSKRQAISVGEGVEKGNPVHRWQECEVLQPLWRTVWQVLWSLLHFWASHCLVTNRMFSREVTSALHHPSVPAKNAHHNGFQLGEEVRKKEEAGGMKEVRMWRQEQLRHASSEWLDQGLRWRPEKEWI